MWYLNIIGNILSVFLANASLISNIRYKAIGNRLFILAGETASFALSKDNKSGYRSPPKLIIASLLFRLPINCHSV